MVKVRGKSLSVGVVGCGSAAQIIHLPALEKTPGVDVVAICDLDVSKAALIANRFGVKKIYGDIEEMVRKVKLDAVFILTPNSMHLPMSLIALRHGVNLFIEKPAARTSVEARRIESAAKDAGCSVMVGMHTRFRRDIQGIKAVIDRGTMGEVFLIKSEWLQSRNNSLRESWLFSKQIAGGGVLLDLGIQMIDAGWWLAGKPKLEFASAGKYQIDHRLQVEDFCSFQLHYSNGLQLAGHIGWNFPIARDRFFAEVFGTSGRSTLNPFKIEKYRQGNTLDITPQSYSSGRVLFKAAYEDEIRHFINFLRGETETLNSDISDAVRVLEMTDQIYAAMHAREDLVFETS